MVKGLKIFVLGTRGIPAIQGGIERHCEQLYPYIAAKGNSVTLCTRRSYVKKITASYRGIHLIHCYALRKKSLEAISHTFIGVLKARVNSPDILHIHGIGPSLLTPLAKLLGLKVVVTNHGPDYDRQKWGKFAKFILKRGEKLGGYFANEVIVISKVIQDIIRIRCNREAVLIPNGVNLPRITQRADFLSRLNLKMGNYILAVGRFVPEKGFHDLIDAFKGRFGNLKLVIAGDADHETPYSSYLRQKKCLDNRIIYTGFITGEELNQIYTHARLFVLPSYHEGLPLALLEALSYGLSVLVSDIPANKEVGLPAYRYFKCGDVNNLRKKMEIILEKEMSSYEEKSKIRSMIQEKYNWDNIADMTIEVYEKVLNRTYPMKQI